MGRSSNSQNRVFCKDDATGRVWTEAADPSKMEDPSLIIYNAMLEDAAQGVFLATNGDQTDTIFDALPVNATNFFRESLNTRQYEPDPPNYTPRISCVLDLRKSEPSAMLSILKKSPMDEGCQRFFFEYASLAPGMGRCITTYDGNGSVLPSFSGEPKLVPILGKTADEIADTFWGGLDGANKVALAVKVVTRDRKVKSLVVRNRHAK